MNTKLHAVTDANGHPIRFYMTAGKVSDYTGGVALLSNLQSADWFREALKDKGITPCIPGRKPRGTPIRYDNRRDRIVIMFGRQKDWRRTATRYDRCPKALLLADAVASIVMFWL